MTLPETFLYRMKKFLGDDFDAFLAEYEKEPTKALHLNSAVIEKERFEAECDFPVSPIPFIEGGYSFSLEKPGNHPLHHAGAFYVQDPSAMLTVNAAPIKRGMKCLDVCAAPGGKSAQIASLIGPEGILVSNEIMPNRCKILAGNVERMGFRNTIVTNADAKRLASWYPDYFDFVLVDAPCSGEGMFRKYPESISEWSGSTPSYCSERQKTILKDAIKTLKTGGYLLYSTCTFSQEENENIIHWLTDNYGFEICTIPEEIQRVTSPGIGMEKSCRIYPHHGLGEGQFFALLQKTEKTESCTLGLRDARGFLHLQEMRAVEDFFCHAMPEYKDLELCMLGDRITVARQEIPDSNVYSGGVCVGTVEKGRLVPHHQLFKAYGSRFLRKVQLDLDDPRLKQYLSGAEIPCDVENGWAVVLVLGVPVGGIKVVDGIGKNHYPKGLRLN